MLYAGYHFTRWPDGSIELDEELTLQRLELEDGDKFVLQVINDKLVLRRVKSVEKNDGKFS